ADRLDYAEGEQTVTATGNVRISRDGYQLSADSVSWDRSTGQVIAKGNVITTDPTGNRVFGDSIELSDSLRDGALDNILLVLERGGRLAAKSGERVGGKTVMNRAVYSPCSVVGADGCAKEPLWQIRAVRVTHDPVKRRISYKDATLEFFGVPVMFLPTLSHPDGVADRATGLLVPLATYNANLGFGLALPYYLSISPAQDLTLTPWVYTAVNPALGFEYRQLFKAGPVQVSGLVTYAARTVLAPDNETRINLGDDFRGYFAANGQLQHNASWRSTFSGRYATDDTFTRRYDISLDDTLRSTYNLERFGSDSYLSIEGWAFQGLGVTDSFAASPIALPLINYLWNPQERILGGTLAVNANSLVISRSDGSDMQRAVASAVWTIGTITGAGLQLDATAQLRGDVYHVSDAALADLPIYAGRDGWNTRFLPAVAADLRWPFAGPALGGIQTLTPRVQLVASPTGRNADIPNEDARSISFNSGDLFAINRFPGYDRWEGGTRVTYGVEYTLDRRRLSLRTQVGQSYRFDTSNEFLPPGTGLSSKTSDIVMRTTLQFGRLLEVTQSLRFDAKSFAARTNEVDIAIGNSQTYATVAYAKFNRNIAIEDLADREELRVGGRVAFAKYWSVFASTILDLTSTAEDPTTTNDGFSPVRHRLGIAYEDECFRIGFSWRHDYTFDRDYQPGNTYLFTVALKNLGP
ncbi:MAG: LPS-assembly protein LptD, partial [Polymorphobacter sp.]